MRERRECLFPHLSSTLVFISVLIKSKNIPELCFTWKSKAGLSSSDLGNAYGWSCCTKLWSHLKTLSLLEMHAVVLQPQVWGSNVSVCGAISCCKVPFHTCNFLKPCSAVLHTFPTVLIFSDDNRKTRTVLSVQDVSIQWIYLLAMLMHFVLFTFSDFACHWTSL